jgi:hypothetical protein
MKTFPIYKPDRIYLSRTLIIILLGGLFLLASYLVQKYTGTHTGQVFGILIWTSFTIFAIGGILKVIGISKARPLYGKIAGELSFSFTEICIDSRTIAIRDITKIEFKGRDWLGLYDRQLSFENCLSNGTKNWLVLYLSDSIVEVRFQKYDACSLNACSDEFISYYRAGKIHWLQLVDNLCLKDPEVLRQLKNPDRL